MSDSSGAASAREPESVRMRRWHRLRRLLTGNQHSRRKRLIPIVDPMPYDFSVQAARQRQAAIERFLGLLEPGREMYVPPERTFEPPASPELESVLGQLGLPPRPTRELEFGAACGQYARLRRQLNNDALLLLDGVIDLVLRLRHLESGTLQYAARSIRESFGWQTTELGRLANLDFTEFSGELSRRFPDLDQAPKATNIGMNFDGETTSNPLLYPYKVVIETNDFQLLYALLFVSRYAYPNIGVGIDWRPRVSSPRRFFQCSSLARTTPGERGTVGGNFDVFLHGLRTANMPTYAVTCAHVLGKGCAAIKVVSWPCDESEEPDAALLETQHCTCLQTGDTGRGLSVGPNPEASAKAHLVTALAPPASSRRRGYVYEPTWYYELDHQWSRFPAAKILPFKSRLAWLFSIIRSPMFARPGDSGAWVVVADQRVPREWDTWIGMVVGGDEKIHTSYVTDGEALKTYFEARLTRELGANATLEPRGG